MYTPEDAGYYNISRASSEVNLHDLATIELLLCEWPLELPGKAGKGLTVPFFIHSWETSIYLSYYVADTVLGTLETTLIKTKKRHIS